MRQRLVAISITGLFAVGCAQGGIVPTSEDEGSGGSVAAGGSGQGGTKPTGTGGSKPTGTGGAATGSGGSTGGGGATTTTTGAGGSQGTGGAQGTGGSQNTGGAGGATTTTTTTGQGGAAPDGGACAESPCKLVSPQCGCAAGQACTLAGAKRVCAAAGTGAEGAECSVDGCKAGFECVNGGGPGPTCLEYCASDKDCTAPGGICLITLDDGKGGEIPGVTLCTTNCSPITNVGCLAGFGCSIYQEKAGAKRFFTMCGASGAGTQGAACVDDGDCAAQFGCLGGECLRWCDASKQACPNALTCVGVVDANQDPVKLGNVTYGVCQ